MAELTSPTPATPEGKKLSINPAALIPSQNIKVAIRLRPIDLDAAPSGDDDAKKKSATAEKRAWNVKKEGGKDSLIQKGTARKKEGTTAFHFDQVFDEDTQTPFIYKSIARGMVKTVLSGRHATIFAYGQTGSGKTYTMQGEGLSTSGTAGIIQLVAGDIFRSMKQGTFAKRDFSVKVSYVEIYNERIRDLLSDETDDSVASHGTPNSQIEIKQSIPETEGPEQVTIRTTGTGDIVLSAKQLEVTTVDQVLNLLIVGNSYRVTASTDRNQHSSRSHAVFRLTIESKEKGAEDDDSDFDGNPGVVRRADFNLVDLAGSESVKFANTSGIRQLEGAKINQSLLTLSTVIHSLSQPEKKRPKHINYRDSKLTRILQPHLSGNAEMAILCCVTPSKAFIEETRSTLKFAARAKLITVKPKVNEVIDDAGMIKRLKDKLEAARKEIDDLREAQGLPKLSRHSTASVDLGDLGSVSSIGEFGDDTASKDDDKIEQAPIRHYTKVKSDKPDDYIPTREELGYNEEGPSYVFGIDDEGIPAVELFDEGPEAEAVPPPAPGAGGRQYVMPKDFGGGGGAPGGDQGGRQYVMPKDFPGIPDGPGTGGRQYVMPKDHALNEDANEPPDGISKQSSSASFQLDAVTEEMADFTVDRYASGHGSFDGDAFGFDSETESEELADDDSYDEKNRTTEPTAMETYEEDEDGPEASYSEVSRRVGSVVSRPATIAGASAAKSKGSKYGTIESGLDRALDGRANMISWDTFDIYTMKPQQTSKPLQALRNMQNKRDLPIPEEVTIVTAYKAEDDDGIGVTERLLEAETRAKFFESQLELGEDLIESLFKDLEKARLCIHDLVFRNVNLAAKLKEKRREDTKEEYQEAEAVLEHYWFLKGSMYVSLFFFFTGGWEYFMAAVILVWLVLEANVSPPAKKENDDKVVLQ